MQDTFGFSFLDSFHQQYEELLIGGPHHGPYGEVEGPNEFFGDISPPQRYFLIFLFDVSAFFIIIVFLNMLIAIMGDIFDEAMERKETMKFKVQLKIMTEYSNLTVEDGDTERFAQYIAREVEDQEDSDD